MYAVYWDGYNEELCAIGVTSAEGVFETEDRLLFPHLFDLGPIPQTNVFGDDIGEIELSDVVFIAVGDTTDGRSEWVSEAHTVVDGANSFTIVWDPDRAVARVAPADGVVAAPAAHEDQDEPRARSWELWQNYPNPFN